MELPVWEKLEGLGEDVARYYWEHISVFRLVEEYDEHWDYFLGQLLKYNRPFSAAHAIVFSGHSNSTMIMNILRKCCELQDYTESTGATFRGLAEHDILNLFEKLHSDQNIELDTHCEKLIEGFISGKQSQRGVHTVTGGMEEKEISIKYREDASKLHISYPHTAAILEKLAECYWQESLYEQKRELLDFRG